LIKITNKEFNLENTLVNGQCFNWSKLDNDKYKGIFRNYYVEIQRLDEETLELQSIPDMSEDVRENVFLKQYLQIPQIKIEDHYLDWCKRDPKFFSPISESLCGVRCLRQDPWECTIGFICSSNNNIKRIA
jgi:N-glycosylase/DNA lyase